MPMLQKGAAMVADKLPKVISPKTHAIIDYANAGSFFLMGAIFMKRNKRAGISAMICGASIVANVLMTDMPGGIGPNSMTTHLKIDAGLAATCAALPSLMNFKEEDSAAKWFMRSEGIAITALGGMTNPTEDRFRERYERAA